MNIGRLVMLPALLLLILFGGTPMLRALLEMRDEGEPVLTSMQKIEEVQ